MDTTTEVARPPIKAIGTLTPAPSLLATILSPNFRLGDFTEVAQAPVELRNFLATKGFKLREQDEADGGLLFASVYGVSMHTDDHYSALWVLAASSNPEEPTQLIVGGEHVQLNAGDVLLFDSTTPHGVISCAPGVWAVFSAYVEELVA